MGWVLNVWEESEDAIQEHPPVNVWKEKGVGGILLSKVLLVGNTLAYP